MFDDAWLCVETMNAVLHRRGLPALSAERYAETFRFPVEAYYRDLPFDWTRESFKEIGLEFMRDYEARRLECRLRDGALDALAFFRARGARQHVISGYLQDTLVELVAHYGLTSWFDEIVGASDVYARGKLDLGEAWARRRGGNSPRLVIGDTVHDHEMAQRIGADCVLIPAGHNARRRLEACGVPVVDGLAELITRLQ